MAAAPTIASRIAAIPGFRAIREILNHTPIQKHEFDALFLDVLRACPLNGQLSPQKISCFADMISQHFLCGEVDTVDYACGLGSHLEDMPKAAGVHYSADTLVAREERSLHPHVDRRAQFHVIDINIIPFMCLKYGLKVYVGDIPCDTYELLLFHLLAHELVHLLLGWACDLGGHPTTYMLIIDRLFNQKSPFVDISFGNLNELNRPGHPFSIRPQLEQLINQFVCFNYKTAWKIGTIDRVSAPPYSFVYIRGINDPVPFAHVFISPDGQVVGGPVPVAPDIVELMRAAETARVNKTHNAVFQFISKVIAELENAQINVRKKSAEYRNMVYNLVTFFYPFLRDLELVFEVRGLTWPVTSLWRAGFVSIASPTDAILHLVREIYAAAKRLISELSDDDAARRLGLRMANIFNRVAADSDELTDILSTVFEARLIV